MIFDVDGTLVDSQGAILQAMQAAFAAVDRPMPDRDVVLSVVGLSLEAAFARLLPQADPADLATAAETYRRTFAQNRRNPHPDATTPFYPGMEELVRELGARDDLLLGIATGKSARGLAALLDAHDLSRCFVTRQVADHHPSKPHPSMLLEALSETGTRAQDAVMIGDTRWDMEMAAAAGIAGYAVSWGYHPPRDLTAARRVLDSAAELRHALLEDWELPT